VAVSPQAINKIASRVLRQAVTPESVPSRFAIFRFTAGFLSDRREFKSRILAADTRRLLSKSGTVPVVSKKSVYGGRIGCASNAGDVPVS